jgi:hypothetical protein
MRTRTLPNHGAGARSERWRPDNGGWAAAGAISVVASTAVSVLGLVISAAFPVVVVIVVAR